MNGKGHAYRGPGQAESPAPLKVARSRLGSASFVVNTLADHDDGAAGSGDAAHGVAGGTSYNDFVLVRYRNDGVEDFDFISVRTNIATIGSGTSTAHSKTL